MVLGTCTCLFYARNFDFGDFGVSFAATVAGLSKPVCDKKAGWAPVFAFGAGP